MRKKNYKGRCEKRSFSKCPVVCKTYDAIQSAYADILQIDDSISKFRCNVLMDELEIGDYTTDFVCVNSNSVQENLQAKIDLADHICTIASAAGSTGKTQIKSVRENRKREQRRSHVDYAKVGGAND